MAVANFRQNQLHYPLELLLFLEGAQELEGLVRPQRLFRQQVFNDDLIGVVVLLAVVLQHVPGQLLEHRGRRLVPRQRFRCDELLRLRL